MDGKRKRDTADTASASTKKQKKSGFAIGPTNLPDGTYKRRVQKIKKNLIEKAKIKKDYAKVKKRDLQLGTSQAGAPGADESEDERGADEEDNKKTPVEPASLDPHPERQAMLDGPDVDEGDDRRDSQQDRTAGRQRRQRTNPYTKQIERAERLKAEADQRRKEREEAMAERDRKIEDRERWRRQMAKARRPGKDGKRKLGRESKLLLEKVQRLVDADKI